jgi:hypothetical protein
VLESPGLFEELIRALTLPSLAGKTDDRDKERHEYVPRSEIKIDTELVMSYVLSHKNLNRAIFGSNDVEFDEGQPEVGNQTPHDDLENYSVSADKAEKLWKLEALRLVDGVARLDTNLLFPHLDLEESESKPSYHLLSTVVDDILFLFRICSLDNEALLMRLEPDIHDHTKFESDRVILRRQTTPADDPGKAAKDKKASSLSKEKKREYIFALVDYTTLVLAKVLTYSLHHGDHWIASCIATLAKLSAKVKVLSEKPTEFAAVALEAAEDLLPYAPGNVKASAKGKGAEQQPPPLAQISRLRDEEATGDTLRSLYYVQESKFRRLVATFLKHVFYGLRGKSYGRAARTAYEVCSVVYETGLEGFKTWVYQDRDGDLEATACQRSLPIARSAFQLLQLTVENLHAENPQNGPPTARKQPLAKIQWSDIAWEDSSAGRATHKQEAHTPKFQALHTIEEVITVMVPLFTASPFIITDIPVLARMKNVARRIHDPDDVSLPKEYGKFKTYFCLFTDDYAVPDQTTAVGGRPGGVATSLSRGLMTRDKLLRGTRPAEIRRRTMPETEMAQVQNDDAAAKDAMHKALVQANRKMDAWIFDEKAVIVSCALYVWAVIAAAVGLVVGGLVFGFTVHQRIKGVDPFGMTTYCWVLAAFVVLIAKSMRVDTWSWRDFLMRRVRCRCVSELHSVTGIDEPLILARLLQDEQTTILNTRGPYNATFKRKADDGFSIDAPLTMWTMLMSGLIMVQVKSSQGPALVCLDVRRGTKFVTVARSDMIKAKQDELLVCMDMERPGELLPLKLVKLDWSGMVGIYNNTKAKFI